MVIHQLLVPQEILVNGRQLVRVTDHDPSLGSRYGYQGFRQSGPGCLVDNAQVDLKMANRRMPEVADAGSRDDTRLIEEYGREP